MAQALEAYRPLLMVVTFGFLGFAFYFTYRPRRRQAASGAAAAIDSASSAVRPKPRRLSMMSLNKAMLWAVTGMAVVFLFFPGLVMGLLTGGERPLTADMQQTVLHVEGMTCYG